MKTRILVVEDEPSILDNVLYALETEGFAPVGCATGEEALSSSEQNRFDLVILDIGLPDTNGFDLCRILRQRSDIPVIFLTARMEEVDRIVGLEIGADDYVVKPFSPRELSARVRAVLRRYGGGSARGRDPREPERTPVAPFQIDEERVRISYYGQVVPLSATELRVLRVLYRHPGRVYSRAQLMEIAWEEPGAAMERTVDAHIKSLRGKLKAIRPEIDPIETHRGLGYSLRENW